MTAGSVGETALPPASGFAFQGDQQLSGADIDSTTEKTFG